MLIWNGIEVCSIGVPCGRVIAWTRAMPGTWKMALAILSMTRKSAELRRSWSALDHQQFGVHPGRGEMPVGGRVAHVGRDVVGQVVAVVVVGLVAGQRRAGRSATARSSRPGSGPGQRTTAVPTLPPAPGPHRALGFQQAETAGDGDHRRAQGQRGEDHDDHADRQRDAQRLEVRQPGEVQAERRAGDRQARAQNRRARCRGTSCSTPLLGPRRRSRPPDIGRSGRWRSPSRPRSPASPAGWSRRSRAR